MPLNKKFISKAFGAAIDSPIVAILAEHGLNKAVSILKQHFSFSAFDIASALQDSYDQALAGIGVGLKSKSKLIQSKLSREFSTQIEPYYFQPFAAQSNISNLRQVLLDNLKGLSKSVFEDSNQNPFSEAELAALINHQSSDDFTDLILEQVGPLNDTLAAFLRFDGLLGNAVLFFFREKIREDERVEKSLAALQREGLWADVADIKQAQEQLASILEQKLNQHKVLIQQALNNNEFDKIASINLMPLNNKLIKKIKKIKVHSQLYLDF